MPIVLEQLKKLARRQLARERPGHTLQTTALVNELYLRLVHSSHVQWNDRAHFLAVASKLMRRVLVDWARARRSDKRGGALARVSLEEANAIVGGPNIDILAVDEALSRLAKVEPLQAEVIELRFFSGMTIEETAEALGVSIDVVKEEWRTARLWLMDALDGTAHSMAAD